MKLTLTNKTSYSLSPEEAVALLEAINAGDRYAILQGDYIMLNAIIAIQDEARLEEAEHIRNGDYRCVHGRWHMRGDRCYGHDFFAESSAVQAPRLPSDTRTPDERYEAERAASAKVREKLNEIQTGK